LNHRPSTKIEDPNDLKISPRWGQLQDYLSSDQSRPASTANNTKKGSILRHSMGAGPNIVTDADYLPGRRIVFQDELTSLKSSTRVSDLPRKARPSRAFMASLTVKNAQNQFVRSFSNLKVLDHQVVLQEQQQCAETGRGASTSEQQAAAEHSLERQGHYCILLMS
jgi:hypothetical protein